MSKLPNQISSGTVLTINSDSDRSSVIEKLVWTAEDVARELKVSLRYVYKLVAADRIPHSKVGRLVRFSPVRVIEWLNKGGTR